MTAPPAGWRPPRIVAPAAPRELPVQDHTAIDDAEERARALTRVFGLVAAVVLTLALCTLCGRAIF